MYTEYIHCDSKTGHLMFHCEPINKILSTEDSRGNVLTIRTTMIQTPTSPAIVLLHYLVSIEDEKCQLLDQHTQ